MSNIEQDMQRFEIALDEHIAQFRELELRTLLQYGEPTDAEMEYWQADRAVVWQEWRASVMSKMRAQLERDGANAH